MLVRMTMRWMCVVVACLLGCGTAKDSDAGSGSGTTSETAMGEEGSTQARTATTESEGVVASDFDRCGALVDEACVVGEDHCICGPRCSEYGPAGAPGRCDPGEFVALCTQTYVCVIPCSVDEDCPDAAMVCRACPEDVADACLSLGEYFLPEFNGGTMMCSYAL